MSAPIHTVPVDDLIEHVTDGGDCPCGPTTEPVERDDGSMGWHVLTSVVRLVVLTAVERVVDECPLCADEQAEAA